MKKMNMNRLLFAGIGIVLLALMPFVLAGYSSDSLKLSGESAITGRVTLIECQDSLKACLGEAPMTPTQSSLGEIWMSEYATGLCELTFSECTEAIKPMTPTLGGEASVSSSTAEEKTVTIFHSDLGTITLPLAAAINLGKVDIDNIIKETPSIKIARIEETAGAEISADSYYFALNSITGKFEFLKSDTIEVRAYGSVALTARFSEAELKLSPGISTAVLFYLPNVQSTSGVPYSFGIVIVNSPALTTPVTPAPLPGTPTIPQPPVGGIPGGVVITPIDHADVPGLEAPVPYAGSITYGEKKVFVYGGGGGAGTFVEGILQYVPADEQGMGSLIIVKKAPLGPVSLDNGLIVTFGDIVRRGFISTNPFDVGGLWGFVKEIAAAPAKKVCEIQSLAVKAGEEQKTCGPNCAYSSSEIPGFTGINLVTCFAEPGVDWSVTVGGCKIESEATTRSDCLVKQNEYCRVSASDIVGFKAADTGLDEDIVWCTPYPAADLSQEEVEPNEDMSNYWLAVSKQYEKWAEEWRKEGYSEDADEHKAYAEKARERARQLSPKKCICDISKPITFSLTCTEPSSSEKSGKEYITGGTFPSKVPSSLQPPKCDKCLEKAQCEKSCEAAVSEAINKQMEKTKADCERRGELVSPIAIFGKPSSDCVLNPPGC